MSLPEPRANPELFGHEAAADALVESALSGRLHHAWLMAGPAGIGKETLAWRFARWLLAGMPEAPKGKPPLYLEPSHPVFRRVAAESHADLLTIDADTLRGDRKRNDINVDAARLIPGFMNKTAAEGGWRVVVVDGVETMNLQAQNAILKVLEEPPARAILLLVSSAPARLLPTIRSRCLSHTLVWPPPDEALAWLQAQDVAASDAPVLLRAAGGRPEDALRWAQAGLTARQWSSLPQALARGEGAVLADWSPAQAIDALQKVCHDLLSVAAGGTSMRRRFQCPGAARSGA